MGPTRSTYEKSSRSWSPAAPSRRAAEITDRTAGSLKELTFETEGKDARTVVPFGPAEIVTIEMGNE
jgi:hypothetical protein